MNEADLLHQLKRGDEAAFAQLIAVYQKKVLNICFRFFLNREDAEDISQEVFIEAFHSIKYFKEEAKLSTWLYRIAVSKSLDEIKKRKRKKRISSYGKLLGIEQITDWMVGNDRPDTKLEENEAHTQLLSVLEQLPENQRVALTLSKIEGYSSAEVAEIMETSINAVDSLIYRAKKNLTSSRGK